MENYHANNYNTVNEAKMTKEYSKSNWNIAPINISNEISYKIHSDKVHRKWREKKSIYVHLKSFEIFMVVRARSHSLSLII